MRLALLLFLTLSTSSTFASTVKLDYSVFFGYMKTMYKLEYEHVTTAFYLLDKNSDELCLINNAQMVVDQKREAVAFKKQGRLLPFFSDQHRKDGAVIEVDLSAGQSASQCDLQVTLMAKESELNNLSFSRLALISEQLEGVLKKNAGMIGKYFLPDFSGVRLQLVEPLTATQTSLLDKQITTAEDGDLLLTNNYINSVDAKLLIAWNIKRITPWLTK